MDTEELKEIIEELRAAGLNPQLCDTEVPHYETGVYAGLPTDMRPEEAFVDMISMPRRMLASAPAVIVDVAGDSMVDVGIYDGDRVLVETSQNLHDGDVVVAMVNGDCTLKCYYEDDEGQHWLVAQNKEKEDVYKPILLEECESARVYGVVRSVMRMNVRGTTRDIRRRVNREKEERRSNAPVTERRVRHVIRDIAPEIEVSRLWFSVYRAMVDAGALEDDDMRYFCELVCGEVPKHAHLPVVEDLQRMEVESFTRAVVLWEEQNAPVKGKRFKKYQDIAKRTRMMLAEE